MKLKQLLEQLNQLAKERPEALEMEVYHEVERIITTYEKIKHSPTLCKYIDEETIETLDFNGECSCGAENFDSILIS